MEIGKSKINVHEYYRNKTVFLSGCTGFIGKVILEKLLWCFPDIKAIYLLIRGKVIHKLFLSLKFVLERIKY